MAACRLASKGRSLADSSYESEVQSIKSFLSMQKPAHAPAVSINPNLIDPQEYLAPRFSKKTKGKVSVNKLTVRHFSGSVQFSRHRWDVRYCMLEISFQHSEINFVFFHHLYSCQLQSVESISSHSIPGR